MRHVNKMEGVSAQSEIVFIESSRCNEGELRRSDVS